MKYLQELACNLVAPVTIDYCGSKRELIGVIKGVKVHSILAGNENHVSFGLNENILVVIERDNLAQRLSANNLQVGDLVLHYTEAGSKYYRKVERVVSNQTDTIIGYTNGTWSWMTCTQDLSVIR